MKSKSTSLISKKTENSSLEFTELEVSSVFPKLYSVNYFSSRELRSIPSWSQLS